jgi:1-aminocyclopropane-1-carboxylate deaminase/D-cysteine desulfhydrase-like pyridoxal-dependent ACC family enzyme
VKNNSLPTPLQEIHSRLFETRHVRLFIKRDDLIHPPISGNKWRKLKYNVLEAKDQQKKTLLTFGGAYSNHIFAVAAAGKIYGFDTIGIIRGEKAESLNKTLSFALDCGMLLHFISRNDYRKKDDPAFIDRLRRTFGDFYFLPEGGTNLLAVKGCAEIDSEFDIEYDYLCCPCGTGGTLAGLIVGNNGKKSLLGFSALKGMTDLDLKIETLVYEYSGKKIHELVH